ncbi:MAG: PAS domain S-box protein [Syntrophus sp. (in: bacteria)]
MTWQSVTYFISIVIAAAVMGCIAWGLYRHQSLAMSFVFAEKRLLSRAIVMLFLLIAGIILTAWFLYYRQSENNFRTEMENQLTTITDLKVSEIVQWKKERLSDANALKENKAFAALVRRFFSDSADGDANGQIRNWLQTTQSTHQYDHVYLLDVRGNTRLSVPQSIEPVCGDLKQHAAEIIRTGRVTFLDLHRDAPGKPIHMMMGASVIENGRPLGLVALSIDPGIYLYPLISRLPTPSRSAETLLVRREGNNALYLNELKFRKNTALNLRVPLTNERIPAVMAALGHEGMVEGVDYRDVPTIAAIRKIPDSSWSIVARMDLAEAKAPYQTLQKLMIAFICTLITLIMAIFWLLWRRQIERAYREKVEASDILKVSEDKFSRIFHNSPYAITLTSTEDGRFIDVNEAFYTLTGFTRDETLSSSSISQGLWVNAEDRNRVVHEIMGGRKVVDQEHKFKKKNGDIITGLFSADAIELETGHFILSSINDITERKRLEELAQKNIEDIRIAYARLEESLSTQERFRKSLLSMLEDEKISRNKLHDSEEKFSTAFRTAPYAITIMRIKDGRLIEVNDAFLTLSGFTREEANDSAASLNLWAKAEDQNSVVSALLAGRVVESKEFRFKKRNGDIFTGLFSAQIIHLGGEPFILSSINDITERKLAEKMTKASLREKEVMLKEIHHRVKNNLQIIASLLKMQSRNAGDEKLPDIFRECQDRIRAMAAVHALLYESENLAEIDFGDYISEMANQLLRSYQESSVRISFSIHAGKVMLAIDAAIPLGLIINELLSNALKYAFPGDRRGEIKIEMDKMENGMRLLLADNGIGLPQDMDFRNTTTMGLKLVNMLVEQLEGTIEQIVNGGTGFLIMFNPPLVSGGGA